MIIRLETAGRTVQEIAARDLQGEIVIGRGPSCVWRVPDDRVVSSQHMILTRRRGSVWAEEHPECKNGTFLNGKRLRKKRLRPGDKLVIGGSVLSVEGDKAGVTGRTRPEIVVTGGSLKGASKQLDVGTLSIGSDPKSGLIVLDDLVSRAHAEICTRPDGSCWIRDLGSRNGTSVNGMALRSEQERLLKDRDSIAIAHVDLKFHDGSSKRVGRLLAIRLAVLLLTLGAAVASYTAYLFALPPVSLHLATAMEHAKARRFDAALSGIQAAKSARGAAAQRNSIVEFEAQVVRWKDTCLLGDSAVNFLQQTNWQEAASALSRLAMQPKEAWDWAPDGAARRTELMADKQMLDSVLRASNVLSTGFATPSHRAEALSSLQSAASLDVNRDYLGPLRTEATALERRLMDVTTAEERLNSSLESLTNFPPRIAPVLVAIESLGRETPYLDASRVERLRTALEGLRGSLTALDSMAERVRGLEPGVVDIQDPITPFDEIASVHPNIGIASKNIQSSRRVLLLQAREVFGLAERMRKGVSRLPAGTDLAATWVSAPAAVLVLQCDVLRQRFPSRTDPRPYAEYDRYLGIDEFYEFLSSLRHAETYSPTVRVEGEYVPLLDATVAVCDAAMAVRRYLDETAHKWMVGREVSRLGGDAGRLLESRDAVVQFMVSEGAKTAGRRRAVALGIACRLAGPTAVLSVAGEPLSVAAGKAVQDVCARVRSLWDTYEAAGPEEKMRLREEIISTGFPGDRIVRTMWYERSESGAAK